MANKKPSRRRRGGVMGMSQIPYAQRLQAQRAGEITANREHGARVAMWCFCVALHEKEGIGYKRIMRFAERFTEIDREFYDDVELGFARAKRRLESMGIGVSGQYYTPPTYREDLTPRERELKNHIFQSVQGAMLCGTIAANDVLGLGRDRLERVCIRTQELTDRYAKEGEGFLHEYLRKLGFTIRDGRVIGFLDEDGSPRKVKEAPHA